MQERRKQFGGYMPKRKVRAASAMQSFPDSHFEDSTKAPTAAKSPPLWFSCACWPKLLRDPEPRPTDRSHRARRSPHFRHGSALPSGRNLFQRRPELRTGRHGYAALLQGSEKRTNSRRRHHRVRFDVFLHRGRAAYANHGINTIPFFIYYSMFGFQRIGDLIWAAADMRCHGFLVGGTAGRTTLAGEGLQHQDGHSHVLALPVPNLLGLRSGVRLRNRHHYSGWHQAHVR